MQGGIIWCLAIKHFKDQPEDVVTNGPSDDVLRFGKLMYYSSNQFWDNGLTENEMDLICGVYKLYSKYRIFITAYFFTYLGPTVHKEQFADVSWWPKQSTFMVLGLNVGYWSADCKAWCQSCMRTILDGTAIIKNACVWSQVMKFEKPRVLKLVQN